MSFECPHCGEILGELTCQACQRPLPEGSRYCNWCGEELVDDAGDQAGLEGAPADDDEGPVDFASRKLCSDGTCIGVIGPDGRCKECGKPYTGDPELEEEPEEKPEEEKEKH
jgi:hypothetical protein